MANKNISKTLIIGLGGTGQAVIRETKKKMFKRYGEVPPLVSFYAIDTDEREIAQEPFNYYYNGQNYTTYDYVSDPNQFRKLTRPLYNSVSATTNVSCRHINKEKLKPIYDNIGDKGANGFRVMGRTHFLYHSQIIFGELQNIITNLRAAALTNNELSRGYNLQNNGTINVFIVASLAGGTGSSAFLDIPQILQLAGLQGTDVIFGVFFMPRFFEGMPNTENKYINTYVALSELDYYFETVGDQMERLTNLYHNQLANAKNSPKLYDNVFLIDNISTRSITRNIKEAAECVGSFVTAAVSADSATLMSSFSNSLHKAHFVDGKRQNYSSLGYCEMAFERQNLVNYLLNRQILEILDNYKTKNMDNTPYYDIVDNFIKNNNLNEGWIDKTAKTDTRSENNQLINSIFDLADKRFNKNFSVPDTGKEAAAKIVKSKDKYMMEIGAEADKCIKDYDKDTIFGNLKSLLDHAQCAAGFGSLPHMAKQLKQTFGLMKEGLELEMEEHQNNIAAKEEELKKLEAFIKTTYGKGIGQRIIGLVGGETKDDAQKARINSYKRIVHGTSGCTIASETLEYKRKEAATILYADLIAIVDQYYKEEEKVVNGNNRIQESGSYCDVKRMYDKIHKLIIDENVAYNPSKEAKNQVVLIDAYLKEYFKKHNVFEMVRNDNEDGISTLDNIITTINKDLNEIFNKQPEFGEKDLATLRKKLLNGMPSTELIRQIDNGTISIDDLFIMCFGKSSDILNPNDLESNPQLKIIAQISTLFDPLWQWIDFQGGDSLPPELNCVVGVNDVNNHIFDIKNGYSNRIPKTNRIAHYKYIGTGDPDKIIFFLQETAIPGFKVSNEDTLKSEYESKKDSTYAFSDKRLEQIEMISPDPVNEMADVAWAYGWMHGLIANRKTKIMFKASYDYRTTHDLTPDSDGYVLAFNIAEGAADIAKLNQFFKRNNELVDDIYNQVKDIVKADKIAEIGLLEEWVNTRKMWSKAVRGKEEVSMTREEIKVIDKELGGLELLLNELNKNKLVLARIVNGRVLVDDSEGYLKARRNTESK